MSALRHFLRALVLAALLLGLGAQAKSPSLAPVVLNQCPDVEWPANWDPASVESTRLALQGQPRLLLALVRPDPGQLKQWLSEGDNPNVCIYADSLLSYSVTLGKLDTVRMLLRAGAHPDLPLSAVGGTPLHAALSQARYDIADLLLANGASLRQTTAHGQTAMHALAMGLGHAREADFQAQTQVLWAQKLMAAGVPVDAQDQPGRSPLMLAAWRNRPELVAFLLYHGANPWAVDKRGDNAIARALQPGHLAVRKLLEKERFVRLLRAGKTDDFIKQLAGCSAPEYPQRATDLLIMSVAHDNVPASQALIQCGADVQQTWPVERDGRTTQWTVLGFAVSELGSRSMVHALLRAGANPNQGSAANQGAQAFSPLHLALSKAQFEIALLLIGHGAHTDTASAPMGNTPLMDAAAHRPQATQQHAAIEVFTALLDKGANVHATNQHQMTALHLAAMAGNVPAIRLLLARGADAAARDKQHQTPCDYAEKARSPEAIKALGEASQCPHSRSKAPVRKPIGQGPSGLMAMAIDAPGHSPLNLAEQAQRPDFLVPLEAFGATH